MTKTTPTKKAPAKKAVRRGPTVARDPKTGRTTPFEPTAEQRKLVQNLAGVACTREEILHCVPWGRPDGQPIAMDTLLKHFATELERGTALSKMRAKKKLQDHIEANHFGALVFYLKTQCGWKETVEVQSTGKDGEPLPPAQLGPVLYLPAKDSIEAKPGLPWRAKPADKAAKAAP
jgi:hypothetical protein